MESISYDRQAITSYKSSAAAALSVRLIAGPGSLIWVLIDPNRISISMNALRPLFPCYWCQRAICTNAGTDCSCQDKCQPRPPCPSLWSWVYYTRLWKSLACCLLRSSAVGALGKVGFPDRKANVEWETGFLDLLMAFPLGIWASDWRVLLTNCSHFYQQFIK